MELRSMAKCDVSTDAEWLHILTAEPPQFDDQEVLQL